jgi:hypothetical protein
MKGIPYKDTFAAKGSELYRALTEGTPQQAKQVYDATTARMKSLIEKKA